MFGFSISSELHATPEAIWNAVHTLRGVNAELHPFARMTSPSKMQDIPFESCPTGQTLLCSWILAFGLIPIDRHCFMLAEVGECYFREQSTSAMHRVWQHHRTIGAAQNGSQLTDEVHYTPRLPLIGYITLPIFKLVFKNRHRYLRRKFNA